MKRLLTTTALALTASTTLAHAEVSIVVNAVQVFGTIDPAKINDYTEYMAAVNMYDGLTTVDGSGAIVPQLAASWTVSDDSLTYNFTLADNATFADGSAVEASDVVYSLQRLLALNEGPSYLFTEVIDPASVKAVDANTVEIGLTKVFSPFLTTTPLILILNKDAVEAASSAEWAEDAIGEASFGAGPYSLSSWKRGSEMVIDRNDDYYAGFGEGTPIDQVRFVITSDEATVKSLASSGQLGMSSDAQANETYESLDAMEGYRVETVPTAKNLYIKMNTKVAPMDDIHVRRAIQYATDYDTIQSVIYPGTSLAGPLADAFSDAYLDTLEAPVYDLEKAAEELAQSKYAGQPITITHTYVAGLSFEEDIALLMQANLEQIGITLDIRPEPWNRITELAASPETTPMTTQIFNGPSYPSPDSVFYVQYHSKSAGTWASMEWLQDPEIDKLIDESRATTDVAAQNDLYKQLQSKLVDGASDVYLLTDEKRIAMSTCLEGYHYIPMMSWDYNFANMHWTCTE
jgi:peptide/nickel transport system substrate-binding protein